MEHAPKDNDWMIVSQNPLMVMAFCICGNDECWWSAVIYPDKMFNTNGKELRNNA